MEKTAAQKKFHDAMAAMLENADMLEPLDQAYSVALDGDKTLTENAAPFVAACEKIYLHGETAATMDPEDPDLGDYMAAVGHGLGYYREFFEKNHGPQNSDEQNKFITLYNKALGI